MTHELNAQPSVARFNPEIESGYYSGHGAGMERNIRGDYVEFTEYEKLASELRAAVEGAARDKQDAERYRYLRDAADPDHEHTIVARVEHTNDWGKFFDMHVSGEELDSLVDAARAALQLSGASK